jgi:predicted amidohydrolase
MKVAAYQAPLLPAGSMDALDFIRQHVRRCEIEGISVLCCPEAILGGLADAADDPRAFAISAEGIAAALEPLSSSSVTSIVGFTEIAEGNRLYNSAAVFHRGSVVGVYRKLHPAINRSVYSAGRETPVFHVGPLTLGIVICNDSNYSEPAMLMARRGAMVLFVPTNNGLPPEHAAEVVAQSRSADIARAVENGLWVVRADVAGRAGELVSYGSSGIVDPKGMVMQTARELNDDLIVAEIDTTPRQVKRPPPRSLWPERPNVRKAEN